MLRRTISVTLLIVLVLSITTSFGAAVSTPSTHIVINEFEPNPPGTDNDNEWVELYNPTSANTDVSGWTLTTTHGSTVTITISSGSISPNGLSRNSTFGPMDR